MTIEKEVQDISSQDMAWAQQTKENSYADFFQTLPFWYSEHNIDIYGTDTRYINRFGHLDTKILSLAEQFNEANRSVAQYTANFFGPDAPITAATALLSELTPLVNTLFYENIQYNKNNTRESVSWSTTSEESISAIQRKVTSICQRPRYQAYFHSSPETAELLDIFAYTLPHLTHANEREDAFAQADILSKRLYEKGLPVFIIPLSEYYSNYGKYPDLPIVPEVAIRLVLRAEPVFPKTGEKMDQMIWNHLLDLHPSSPHQKKPYVLLGNWVMSAGGDMASITSAERLSKSMIVILSNTYKQYPLVKAAAELTQTTLTNEDIQRLIVFSYTAHEFGHFYYDMSFGRYFEELDTDLTMLHEALTNGESYGFSIRQLVCFLLGDYVRQAMQEKSLSITSDGYRKSGIHIIEKLLDSGYISIENDRITIGDGHLDHSVLTDHKAIHDQNHEVLAMMRKKELSEKGRRIAELVLASHI